MKRFVYNYILPYFGLLIIKAISATYRIKVYNAEIEDSIYKRGEVPIHYSWHQRLFSGIAFFPKRHPISIMISQSKDGDLIARIVKILGWQPVRGSSSRGGSQAFRKLLELINSGFSVGHIVDGPRGPHGKIKPGLLKLAQQTGMPILPTIVSAEKKWVFNSWDRFIIPKPFSKIALRFEKETYIPADLKGKEFEETVQAVESSLYEFYRTLDEIWEKK